MRCAHGEIAWREAGTGPAAGAAARHRLRFRLRGSGSSRAWLQRFACVAWDAPGYGESAPSAPRPRRSAQHYAQAAGRIARSRCSRAAACWWATRSARSSRGLRCASQPQPRQRAWCWPAPHAATPRHARQCARPSTASASKLVERLGIEGMAASARPACAHPAPTAPVDRAACARTWRARRPAATARRRTLLAHDDLLAHLAKAPRRRCAVLCGEHDAVTPPAACEQVAREMPAAVRAAARRRDTPATSKTPRSSTLRSCRACNATPRSRDMADTENDDRPLHRPRPRARPAHPVRVQPPRAHADRARARAPPRRAALDRVPPAR